MIKIIKNFVLVFIALTSFSVMAEFNALSTKQVQEKMSQGVAVIDIRRQDEYDKYGIIPGAHKLTFFDGRGNHNAQKWLADFSSIVKGKDTPFILVCAHANRTKVVGNFLSNKVGYKNVFELEGGIINGWIDKDLATTKIKAGTSKPWYKLW
ncbi:rhodanese-like domain-containing protein [Bathymodiolus septemdierum thioautotrophic gill symbiont]|uniref:Rhodanese domain protein n=1 Tax=endosymbiont of Bathymodiolus septemdierum str. Myojin knoll TaxID=1303921 RepID=A0A0N7KBA7_9GAMM|nr:rhodanese-like domain-containing protein [Bathymodiolus septemdierum thioautotrophic gill symbiont]BAS67487.1 rhodanese domain protein [endosymbiont of Bathymodiolus septemdierum str. Myojin knoll]